MNRFLIIVEAALLLTSIFLIAVVLALLSHGSTELASWVQAVGSIAALGIAIWVMSRQNKHSAKLVSDADKLATLRRARSVYAVLKRSHNQIRTISGYMLFKPTSAEEAQQLQGFLKNGVEILEAMEPLLKGIPAFDLGGYDMADGVLQFTETIDPFKTAAIELHTNPTESGMPHVCRTITSFHQIFSDAMLKFEKGMKELET